MDIPWVPELSMNITLRFDFCRDQRACWCCIGALVLLYRAPYFHHRDGHTEGGCRVSPRNPLRSLRVGWFGLVTSDNTLLLYLFWS